jgi:hypothetical protein
MSKAKYVTELEKKAEMWDEMIHKIIKISKQQKEKCYHCNENCKAYTEICIVMMFKDIIERAKKLQETGDERI